MEFLVTFFTIYVSFHTHLFFSKMLKGITCRYFFKGCTAVFSDMRLIFELCKLLILCVFYDEERGVCPDLQSQNRLGTSFSPFKKPLVAQLRNSVLRVIRGGGGGEGVTYRG